MCIVRFTLYVSLHLMNEKVHHFFTLQTVQTALQIIETY